MHDKLFSKRILLFWTVLLKAVGIYKNVEAPFVLSKYCWQNPDQYQGLWLPTRSLIDCILFFHMFLLVLSPQVVGYLLLCPDKTCVWIPWPQAYRVIRVKKDNLCRFILTPLSRWRLQHSFSVFLSFLNKLHFLHIYGGSLLLPRKFRCIQRN